MRYLLLLIVLVYTSCGSGTKDSKTLEEDNTTTYYLIRHAEKDRTAKENPGLTVKGNERAMHWATYFENIDLDAVYSTTYTRTKQTAAPTAKKKSLTVKFYSADSLYNEPFQLDTKGQVVLVVGHSNTTPAFVNAILGERKYPQIDDTENGLLYKVVVPENGKAIVTIEKVEI